MDRPDINQGNSLIIRNGDFAIENCDFVLAPHVEANIGLYYVVAQRHLHCAVAHDDRLRPMIQAVHSDAHSELTYQLSDWLQQWTIPTTTFAALCAEALINYYGAHRLPPEEWAHYVTGKKRRISALKKFIELPGKVGGIARLTMPNELAQSLGDLFNIRNRTVHFKTHLVSQGEHTSLHHITIQQCREALATVRRGARYLVEVDGAFDFNLEEYLDDERYTSDYADNIRRYEAFCGPASGKG